MVKKSLIVPLRKSFQRAAPKKRGPKAVRALRAFLKRHLKVDEVKIGPRLNEALWSRGIKHPPAKVAVSAEVVDKVAKVELEGFDYPQPVEQEHKHKDESLKDKLASKIAGKDDSKASEKDQSEQSGEEQKQDTEETKVAKEESKVAKKEADSSSEQDNKEDNKKE